MVCRLKHQAVSSLPRAARQGLLGSPGLPPEMLRKHLREEGSPASELAPLSSLARLSTAKQVSGSSK